MQGFVWSLMSAEFGGFLKADDVIDVRPIRPGLLKGKVIRNFNGEYKEDPNYEFWEEQFIEMDLNHPVTIPINALYTATAWKRGAKVKVYARQYWGGLLEEPINGTVYQDQHTTGSSVIVAVHPGHFPDACINGVGGHTLEVYPQQLRSFQHEEIHPTSGSASATYNNGFRPARQYREKISWFSRFFG